MPVPRRESDRGQDRADGIDEAVLRLGGYIDLLLDVFVELRLGRAVGGELERDVVLRNRRAGRLVRRRPIQRRGRKR